MGLVEAAEGGVFRSDNGGRNWTKRQRAEHPAPARLVLQRTSSPTPRMPTPCTRSIPAMYRSIDGGRTFAPSARRTATITICGSRPTIRAHDREQRRRRHDHLRWRPDLVAAWTISRPRSSIAWRSITTFRITSTARSRTTPPCASPAAPTGGGITRTGLVRRGRRRKRLDRARSARFADRLCRLVRRAASPARTIAPGRCRNINAWPDNTMGYGVEAMKYRFQWSFPMRSRRTIRRRCTSAPTCC